MGHEPPHGASGEGRYHPERVPVQCHAHECECMCMCMCKCKCMSMCKCMCMCMCMCCERWICVGMGKDHMGMAVMAAGCDGAPDAREGMRAARRRRAAVTYRIAQG